MNSRRAVTALRSRRHPVAPENASTSDKLSGANFRRYDAIALCSWLTSIHKEQSFAQLINSSQDVRVACAEQRAKPAAGRTTKKPGLQTPFGNQALMLARALPLYLPDVTGAPEVVGSAGRRCFCSFCQGQRRPDPFRGPEPSPGSV